MSCASAGCTVPVHSIPFSARGGRETCMPRVSPQGVVGQRKGVLHGVCVKREVGRDELPVLHLAWPATFPFSLCLGWECFCGLKGMQAPFFSTELSSLLNPLGPLTVVLHTLQDFTGTSSLIWIKTERADEKEKITGQEDSRECMDTCPTACLQLATVFLSIDCICNIVVD